MRIRINWAQVLRELRAAGVGQNAVADFAETSQAAISRLATGGTEDPAHSVGERILELHRQRASQSSELASVADSSAELAASRRALIAIPGDGVIVDRRDPTRISPYAGTDIDRRAAAPTGE
jgi:predicted transcriptional regulator